MTDLLGKWEQPEGQPFPGLWFEFKGDGTYQAELASMGILSGGTYVAAEGKIDMDQTEHTLGWLGKFEGIYAIEGDTLRLALNNPGEARPVEFTPQNTRIYQRIG